MGKEGKSFSREVHAHVEKVWAFNDKCCVVDCFVDVNCEAAGSVRIPWWDHSFSIVGDIRCCFSSGISEANN